MSVNSLLKYSFNSLAKPVSLLLFNVLHTLGTEKLRLLLNINSFILGLTAPGLFLLYVYKFSLKILFSQISFFLSVSISEIIK